MFECGVFLFVNLLSSLFPVNSRNAANFDGKAADPYALKVLKDATPNSVLNDTDDEDATEGNRRIKSCPGDLQDDASSDGSIGKAHSLAIEEEALTTHASDEVAPICVRTLGLLRQVSSLDPQCPTSSREFLWLSSFNNPIFDTSSHGEDMAVEGMLSKQSSPEQGFSFTGGYSFAGGLPANSDEHLLSQDLASEASSGPQDECDHTTSLPDRGATLFGPTSSTTPTPLMSAADIGNDTADAPEEESVSMKCLTKDIPAEEEAFNFAGGLPVMFAEHLLADTVFLPPPSSPTSSGAFAPDFTTAP